MKNPIFIILLCHVQEAAQQVTPVGAVPVEQACTSDPAKPRDQPTDSPVSVTVTHTYHVAGLGRIDVASKLRQGNSLLLTRAVLQSACRVDWLPSLERLRLCVQYSIHSSVLVSYYVHTSGLGGDLRCRVNCTVCKPLSVS
jgi:hypothetical protein